MFDLYFPSVFLNTLRLDNNIYILILYIFIDYFFNDLYFILCFTLFRVTVCGSCKCFCADIIVYIQYTFCISFVFVLLCISCLCVLCFCFCVLCVCVYVLCNVLRLGYAYVVLARAK